MEEILHQLIYGKYHIIYIFLAPSQVVFSPDFWTIHHQVQRFNPRILSIPDVAPNMVAWDVGFFPGWHTTPVGAC